MPTRGTIDHHTLTATAGLPVRRQVAVSNPTVASCHRHNGSSSGRARPPTTLIGNFGKFGRFAWSELLDRAEAGQVVTVSRRGRAKLAVVPWTRYAVRPRRQERGRALCLQWLVAELRDAGVSVLAALGCWP
ncbi:type II toxin-antitoxin system prevent-host-death family antitoxin [Amycolatopsis mediterranei]|uniref:type II toxin-antitoxin system Phd/YefM family antitoxin n=1 Tax=Amycolatopsis mediterranei TaxID=33910 RepID=UPI00341D0765